MLSVQNLLPRLPVPKLGESLTRYLRAVRPLLTNDEYTNTERAVADFVNSGVGPKLQCHLEQRATKHENWLADWWLNGSYLEYRDPLVLFSNPSFYWPVQKLNAPDDQFRMASSVISAALDYRAAIVKHELKPETVGKDRRLCMHQYVTLFDSCRVPAPTCDKSIRGDFAIPKPLSKNVSVGLMYRNRFYNLNVDSTSSDPQSIFDAIITMKQQQDQTLATPVGMFTAWDRDNWAVAHDKLEKAHQINATTLEAIRHCALIICLDTQPLKPIGPKYNVHTRSLDNVLHGGGSFFNTPNRWFDKTVQLMVSHDGMAGFCQEHSPCEALPTVALSDYVATRVLNNQEKWRNLTASDGSHRNTVKPMDFKLTPELEKSLDEATRATDKIINDMETHVEIAGTWGRDGAKKIAISADGLLQMGLQLAYYRIHGKPGSCYETGSTRRFILGRTETIRPCSVESTELCKEVAGKKVDKGKAKELLLKALTAHQEYSNAALIGRGFDRHFMGLKRTAVELGIPLPTIFTEKGYQIACHHMISTSQVSSVIDGAGMGYGPLQPDGYGCCYNIRPDKIQLSISAWRSCPTTDPHRFGEVAADSLDKLYTIAREGSMRSKVASSA